jgi:Cu+-exporting ATPase
MLGSTILQAADVFDRNFEMPPEFTETPHTHPSAHHDHGKPGEPPQGKPRGESTELVISGMTCSGCARHVTEALQGVPHVASAWVSLEDRRASVRWESGQPAEEANLLQAVAQAGYQARSLLVKPASADHHTGHESHQHSGTHTSERLWSGHLTTALGVTALLMVGEWLFQWGTVPWFRWFSFVLAAVVQFGPGLQFYRGAWNQLRVGSSNMDTLVALGSTTAFVYSVWTLFSGATPDTHLYFMEAAAIIALISAGHFMEARVGAKASSALHALLQLAPTTARRRAQDGTEAEVPIAQLRAGELVILKPGDRIPVDGRVSEGASTVDESMLTGESLPVEKSPGAELFAGTSNLTGQLVLTVTGTGEDTALAHIIEAVRRAQTSRAEIQRLGDRVSNVFVPVVVLIALGTALWWGLWPTQAHQVNQWLGGYLWAAHPPTSPLAAAVVGAASVLIIACPCAMGLATPAAIMAGANAAARRGILIRDGVALEKAGQVTSLLFDKTGTLTTGRPEVVETKTIVPLPTTSASTSSELSLLSLAAALARPSNHPLSRAVAQLDATQLQWSQWREHPGSGVEGTTPAAPGSSWRLGSLRWLAETGVALGAEKSWLERWSSQGATVLGLTSGRQLHLLLALRDRLKPDARQVVEQLTRDGLRVHLVTGDQRATATSLGQLAGFLPERVFAEVRPQEKAALVKQLQDRGESVAFVGDGINDAPALEQANLGIAVSRASDIAREAADVVLLRSDIGSVPESLALARTTLRTIRQNLFWAFFYNAAGIPLAALGFMSPVLCAAAMGLSDLVVIGNSLRLLRWKARDAAKPGA